MLFLLRQRMKIDYDLKNEIGLEAQKDFESLQKGDVVNTLSDNTVIDEWIGTYPKTSLKKGIKIFINWFKDYYNYQC